MTATTRYQWMSADERDREMARLSPIIAEAEQMLATLPDSSLVERIKADVEHAIATLRSGPTEDSPMGAWNTCPWGETLGWAMGEIAGAPKRAAMAAENDRRRARKQRLAREIVTATGRGVITSDGLVLTTIEDTAQATIRPEIRRLTDEQVGAMTDAEILGWAAAE